jgi:hypothetical protein
MVVGDGFPSIFCENRKLQEETYKKEGINRWKKKGRGEEEANSWRKEGTSSPPSPHIAPFIVQTSFLPKNWQPPPCFGLEPPPFGWLIPATASSNSNGADQFSTPPPSPYVGVGLCLRSAPFASLLSNSNDDQVFLLYVLLLFLLFLTFPISLCSGKIQLMMGDQVKAEQDR